MSIEELLTTSNFSFLVSVAILVYVHRGFRRNESTAVEILESSTSGREAADENQASFFVHYKLRIRNIGLPLHDTTVAIEFAGHDGERPLKARVRLHPTCGKKQCEHVRKGMIAEFHFKSYECPDGVLEALGQIEDARRQRARIVVRSQGNEAAEFRAFGTVDKIKRTANNQLARLASWVIEHRHTLMYHAIAWMPIESLSWDFDCLGQMCRDELEKRRSSAEVDACGRGTE